MSSGWRRLARAGFRPSTSRSALRDVAVTLLQSAVFWVLLLGVVPALLVRLESSWNLVIWTVPGPRWWPWVLFAVAGSVGLWSGVTMALVGRGTPLPLDCARRLVVRGPYRWVRNPMAVAGITQGVAVGLWLGSGLTIAYSLAGAVLWHVLVRPVEEEDLAQRFDDDYRRYREAVRCWWPRFVPFDPERSPFSK